MNDLECPPLLTGCGPQHPHRALGGTCVLLAAAPTTPPCFRHWRRSSSLHSSHFQRKNYFKFRDSRTPAGVPLSHFHSRGHKGKPPVNRYVPPCEKPLRRSRARFPLLSPAVTSSPEAGEVFPLRESQGLRLAAKVLSVMRKFLAKPSGFD